MRNTKIFVEKRLKSVLEDLKQNKIGSNVRELNIYDRTLIYHYTDIGYDSLNENLRDGKKDEYEYHLNKALDKLPNFQAVVYRGVKLTSNQITMYKNAEKNNSVIVEKAFTSCTTSIVTANLFGNTIFSIISKTGKKIEDISNYGINSPLNEKEVLFKSKAKFKVLEVKKVGNNFEIILEEII